MADAFRGLTIRLGADARPLNSAINSISSSAAAAQKQLNRLNKAATFDKSNAAMMQSRIDLMGDKAMHSAKAFEKIKTAMRQAANESKRLTGGMVGDSKGFAKLVNGTKEAHYETQKLRDELYTVDASLQHMYDSMARVVMRSKELGNTDDVLKSAAMRMKGLSDEGAAEYIQKLKNEMKGTGEAAEKAKSEFKELMNGVHVQDAINYVKKLGDETRKSGADADKAKAEFERLMTEAASSSGLAEKFGKDKNAVNELLDVYRKLREQHKALSQQQEAYNAVEGFRAMKVEAQAYRAELRQSVADTARLKSELYALGSGGQLMSAVDNIRALDNATEKAVANAHQMISAYRTAPTSFDAAVAKIKAVAAAEETLRARTAAIKDAMQRIQNDPAFDKMAASSKGAYTNAVRIEQEYTKLGTALDIVTARLDELNKTKRDMETRGVDTLSNDYKKNANSIKLAESAIDKLKSKLHGLEGEHAAAALTIQFKEFETQLAEATTKAAALHSQVSKLRAFSSVGKSLREFGFGMYASLTPAITMAGRYAIQSAEDIDAAYRNVRKTLNGTEQEYEGILNYALEYSRTHVTSAESMLNIMSMGAQLGIQDGQRLQTFAKTISDLDIATDINADDAAEQLGKLATVIGIDESEYSKFGDALVRLGNNMPAMESDVMKITTRFAGMGKVVGLSADQMLGWATAATAVGMKPEAAGSSMLRFISKMETAVNGSDEDLQKWANVAGMSASDFRAAFEEDASGAMYKFVEGMGEFQKSGQSVNQLLADLGVGNVRDKILLEGLANQMTNTYGKSNLLAEALGMAHDAYNGLSTDIGNGKIEKAGDAAREAEKKSEGFSGAMGKMRNQAKYLANQLAEGAAPIVKDLGQVFGDLAGAVGEMPPEMKTFAVEIAGILALLGPATVGVGTFLQSFERVGAAAKTIPAFFTNVAASINPLAANSLKGAKALSGLQKTLRFMGTGGGMLGIAAAGVAIGVVVDAIQDYIEQQETLKKATDGVLDVTNRSARLDKTAKQSLDEYGDAAGSAAVSVDELVKSTASMVDAQNDRASSAEKDIGQLKAAQQVIDQYMNTDLSGNVSAQGQLKAAVALLNEKYGAQISIIDAVNGKLADETGKIMETCGAIDQLIQKKQEQIRTDALTTQLSEQTAQLDTAVATWVEAQQAADDYYKTNQQLIEQGQLNPEGYGSYEATTYEKLRQDAATAKAEVDTLNEATNRTSEILGNVMANEEGFTRSVENAAKANSTLYGSLSGNELDDFAHGLQQAGMTMDEFYSVSKDPAKWGEAIMAWRSNEHSMSEVMKTLGLDMRSLSEQYKTEMQGVQSSTQAWEHAMKVTKMGGDELATALDGAGVSAAQFASIGSNAFDALWQISGKSLDGITQGISLVNSMGFEPKDLSINDEGVVKVKDTVLELDGDIARLGNREFKLNADTGQFEEVKQQVQQIADEAEEGADMEVDTSVEGLEETAADIDEIQQKADEGAEMEVAVDSEALKNVLGEMLSNGELTLNASINFTSSGVDEVNSTWETLKSSIAEGATGDAKVSYDTLTTALSTVQKLSSGISSLPDKRVKVTITGGALSTLSSIATAIRNLHDKTVTITTVKKSEGGSATGGISRVPLIPRNAAGGINGIATRALLTNQGWVGEDGAEALLSMGHRNAIVPLSNRRYVRPFARAVASEMGGVQQVAQPSTTMNIYLDGRYLAGGVNENTTLGDLAKGLRRKARC